MKGKFKLIDYFIILVGVTSCYLGIQTMLNVQTLILPAWTLVLMYGGLLLAFAFGVGALTSWLTKSKLNTLTASSLIISIACFSFYISQFKPGYDIVVPDNYQGEVKLFRSKLNKNKLTLSAYGVGYITDKAYRNGFRPTVYKNGKDITHQCKTIVQGSVAFARIDGQSIGPFSYVGFTIGDGKTDTIWNNLTEVIEQKIVDTMLLLP